MVIPELLLKGYEKNENKILLVDDSEDITYKDFYTSVNTFAANLFNEGLKKGDKVCLLLNNTKNYIISFFALMTLGCIVIPLDPKIQEELVTFINDSEAKLIIAERDRIEFIKEHLIRMPSIEGIIINNASLGEESRKKCFKELNVFLKKNLVTDHNIEVNDSDIACYIYTSGTVKRPKGVMLTHSCLTFNVQELNSVIKATQDDIVFNILPFYHCYGLCTNLLLPIFLGATIVLHHNYSLNDIINRIHKTNSTILSCVPLLYEKLKKDIYSLGELPIKKYISSGAKLSYTLIEYYKNNYDIDIINAYGSSETNTIAINMKCYHSKPNSVGTVLPSLKVKILDESGNELPYGERGEIVISTPKIMLGYHNMETETLKVLRDGWYYTGDVGYITEYRELFITGRKREMFNVAGKKVFKDDVESVLMSSGYFSDVNVAAKEDLQRGERIIAYVCLKSQVTTVDDILRFCREKMAPHKIPKEIIFCETVKKAQTWKESV